VKLLNKEIVTFLENKNFTVSNDRSTQIINIFDQDDSSDLLYTFLKSHRSCRILFNASVKTKDFLPNIDIFAIYPGLNRKFESENTSFLYIAKCKLCNDDIDSIYITETDFKLPTKTIRCTKHRKKVTIDPEDYRPLTNISRNDLIRFLNEISEKFKVLTSSYALECIYCDNPFELIGKRKNNVNLSCKSCNNKRYVVPLYLFDEPIQELMKDRHGHWITWYVWKQLKDLNAENSLIFKNRENESIQLNADICLIRNGKLIIIECKDSHNLENTNQKINLINNIADIFILVTTEKINPESLDFIKKRMKIQFFYTTHNDIDDFGSYIRKI
jgi:hypothetical protein